MNIISDTIRVPGSYNEVDESGANAGLPAYRQPLMIVAAKIKTPSAWVAATAYTVGTVVKPTTAHDDGHYYICIVAGTSHASTEPTWPGSGGSVVDNGTLKWRELIDASQMIAVNTPTRIFSGDEAAALAGSGSFAHRMAQAAFDQYSGTEVYINLVDDAQAGVKSTCTVTIAGTAVGAGSLELRIGNDRAAIAIADGDTAAEIATALDAAIAELHTMPATPSVASAVVTLQAKNAGVPGNELGRCSSGSWYAVATITGTTGITATITAWASGATNPDITTALAAASSGTFSLVAIPYRDSTNMTALDDYMTEVSNAENCRGARGFVAITSTVADASTAAAINSKRIHVALKRGCKYTSIEIAAAFAAMHAEVGHAALPLNHMDLKKCDASSLANMLERDELNALLWAGVTPFNDDSSGTVRCVRSITTYTTNAFGSPDPLYLDTTTVANIDYARRAVKLAEESAFSQAVLRENHVDGEPSFVITPDDVASLHFNVFKELEVNGNVQMVDFYKDRFRSVRSATVPGRVESDIPIEVVQGAHIFANYFRIVSSVGR